MKKIYKSIVWILGTLTLLTCIAAFCFLSIGDWLHNDDSPVKADAIILLGGNPSRAYHAADLYHQGYAPYIYLSVPRRTNTETLLDNSDIFMPREEEINRQVLIKKGIPTDSIITLDQTAVSTADEADEVSKIVKSNGCCIIVVTSPYHVRRAKMIFRDNVQGCDVRVVGSSYEPYPSKWWKDKELAGNIILEIHKIIFYELGGRFSRK
jgi:uncharacterized SAM-binding protein YcdF (DUF218 family)